MNSEKNKASKPHILILKLTDKLYLRRGEKILLYQILVFTIHEKNIKSSYKSHKFEVSAPTWNDEFELPDGSYLISDIEDYFEYIFKRHGEKIDNPSIRIYVNKVENRITFKIKTGYYLVVLTPETIKLLGSTNKNN